jgi:ubiquinol-cytochrome c reductase iron-sulfur subunit
MKGFGIVTTASSAEHPTRRDFLFVATGAAAAVGGLVTLWPFISQMNPDASTIAAGAPIEVDLAPIAEGQDIKVFWRGKPIYIMNRTKKQVEEARSVAVDSLKDPASDESRVKAGHDQWLVVIGICTHLDASRLRMRATTTASSVLVTVRSTIPPVVFARGRHRPTCPSRLTHSFPTLKSRSAKDPAFKPGTLRLSRRLNSLGIAT